MAKRLSTQFLLETAIGDYTHVELSVWHEKGGYRASTRQHEPSHISFSINPCRIQGEMVIVPMGKGINIMVLIAPRYNERKMNAVYTALVSRAGDLIPIFVSGKRDELLALVSKIVNQTSF